MAASGKHQIKVKKSWLQQDAEEQAAAKKKKKVIGTIVSASGGEDSATEGEAADGSSVVSDAPSEQGDVPTPGGEGAEGEGTQRWQKAQTYLLGEGETEAGQGDGGGPTEEPATEQQATEGEAMETEATEAEGNLEQEDDVAAEAENDESGDVIVSMKASVNSKQNSVELWSVERNPDEATDESEAEKIAAEAANVQVIMPLESDQKSQETEDNSVSTEAVVVIAPAKKEEEEEAENVKEEAMEGARQAGEITEHPQGGEQPLEITGELTQFAAKDLEEAIKHVRQEGRELSAEEAIAEDIQNAVEIHFEETPQQEEGAASDDTIKKVETFLKDLVKKVPSKQIKMALLASLAKHEDGDDSKETVQASTSESTEDLQIEVSTAKTSASESQQGVAPVKQANKQGKKSTDAAAQPRFIKLKEEPKKPKWSTAVLRTIEDDDDEFEDVEWVQDSGDRQDSGSLYIRKIPPGGQPKVFKKENAQSATRAELKFLVQQHAGRQQDHKQLNGGITYNVVEKTFRCKICHKEAEDIIRMRRHMKVHTGIRPYQCDICKRAFTERANLKRHMSVHSDTQVIVCHCEYCGKPFKDHSDMRRHVRIHTGEKPYQCSRCPKAFKEGNHLKVHFRTHTGEKPYHCQYCAKRFAESSNFKRHMRSHTGLKPYKCEQCLKSFRDSTTLKKHMLTHSGEKGYTCPVCSKTFNCKYNMATHFRTHTHDKIYTCGVCDRGFTHHGSFQVHLRTHTGEKPWKCNYCNKRFSEQSNFNRHVNMHIRNGHTLPEGKKTPGERVTLLQKNAEQVKRDVTQTGRRIFKQEDEADAGDVEEVPLFEDVEDYALKRKNEAGSSNASSSPTPKKLRKSPTKSPRSAVIVKKPSIEEAMNKYACTMCHKFFGSEGNLKFHMRAHTGAFKPFQCQKCDEEFNFSFSLKKHLIQAHKFDPSIMKVRPSAPSPQPDDDDSRFRKATSDEDEDGEDDYDDDDDDDDKMEYEEKVITPSKWSGVVKSEVSESKKNTPLNTKTGTYVVRPRRVMMDEEEDEEEEAEEETEDMGSPFVRNAHPRSKSAEVSIKINDAVVKSSPRPSKTGAGSAKKSTPQTVKSAQTVKSPQPVKTATAKASVTPGRKSERTAPPAKSSPAVETPKTPLQRKPSLAQGKEIGKSGAKRGRPRKEVKTEEVVASSKQATPKQPAGARKSIASAKKSMASGSKRTPRSAKK